VAAGVNGVFMEVHNHPSRALSDGANSLDLRRFKPLVSRLRDLADFVQKL
jgi:3-deoxy-D-manno-octulosonic acid (KDO) 8-phosphate synthase